MSANEGGRHAEIQEKDDEMNVWVFIDGQKSQVEDFGYFWG